MDIRKGYEQFLRGIDKFRVSSVNAADFLYWYHIAQQDFVDQRLAYFELTGAMDDDLVMLAKEKKYVDIKVGQAVLIPEDYYRTSVALCEFSFINSCDKTEKGVQRVLRLTGDKEGFILGNPYYAPSIDRWYYRMSGKEIKLYGSSEVTNNTLTLSYVKELPVLQPSDVDASSETIWKNDQLSKITQKATALFLENKQSPRIASYPQVNKVDQL